MTRALLTDRLADVQAALARKQQVREVVTAQLNALAGREAELLELLALVDTPSAPAPAAAETPAEAST